MVGTDSESLKKEAAEFAEKHGINRIAFVIPEDAENGPPEFKIAPDADVTVVCYREARSRPTTPLPRVVSATKRSMRSSRPPASSLSDRCCGPTTDRPLRMVSSGPGANGSRAAWFRPPPSPCGRHPGFP